MLTITIMRDDLTWRGSASDAIVPRTISAERPDVPPFYTVPLGTRPSKCSGPSCGKTIYFIQTPRGKFMPIDCDVPGGMPPKDSAPLLGEDEAAPGRGVPHFGTCPDVDRFDRPVKR